MNHPADATPLISVIVPVYKVEAHIRECVDSILAQTYKNLEIILVDDGSPDGCPAICDAYARKDERVRVIHKENGGLSDARNAGIEAATGDYIGFVDSDDWIEPDMYEYLYKGAAEHDADVTVCEYYNVWKTKQQATYRSAVRVFPGQSCVRALLLLKIGNYAWNKLYRRSVWMGDVRYPVGLKYEDVRTTYRLFENVNKVVALPEAKYYYRRHGESITGRKTVANQGQCLESRMKRFDVVADRWPDVRSFLIKEIYDYLVQFRDVVCKAPAEEFASERELVDYITVFLKTHHDEIVTQFGWGRIGRMSFSCMESADQASWRRSKRIEGINDKKTKLLQSKMLKKYRDVKTRRTKQNRLDAYYEGYSTLPLDERAAFVESRGGEDFAGNMFMIAQELCARGVKVYLCAKPDHRSKIEGIIACGSFPGMQIVEKESDEFFKVFATAKYHFNDMVYSEYLLKTPGQVWVNTWHGTPLKNLEFDVANQRHVMGGGTRANLQCDYLVVPSRYLADKLLESSHTDQLYRGKVLYSGYPRNGVFFDKAKQDRIIRELGLENKEVFAYMPTWRGTLTSHVGTTGVYDTQAILDFFEKTLSDDQVLYVKLHNYAASSVSYAGYSHVLPFPEKYDSYEVLSVAQCLITDYSSVFFDYANGGGKIVLFTYDRDEYLADRGLYIDLDELPFPKANTYEELAEELNLEKRYDDADFLKRYCTFDGPDATNKLLDTVLEGKECCPCEWTSHNGKRNILLYDARFNVRDALPDEIADYLAGLNTDEANYYYGIRQWVLKKTPKYLMNLPEGVRLYPLSNHPEPTSKERATMKRSKGACPASLADREVSRQFYGNPFDEIRVLYDNEYDPFAALLKLNPRYVPGDVNDAHGNASVNSKS